MTIDKKLKYCIIQLLILILGAFIMKTIKKLRVLLIFLSLIALLFVSCKNEDKTGSGDDSSNGSGNSEITLAHYAGNWYGSINNSAETLILTINDDGSFTDSSNKKFSSSDITRNNEKSYTLPDGSELNFNSYTQGTFKLQGNDSPVNITKKNQ